MTTSHRQHRYTAADFEHFATRHAVRYRLPALGRRAEGQCVAEGWVDECEAAPGLWLIASDIRTHAPYECTVAAQARLSALVMLGGRARVAVGGDATALVAGGAYTLVSDDRTPLHAVHAARERLRTLNVTVLDPDAVADPQAADALRRALRTPNVRATPRAPALPLRLAAEAYLADGWAGALQGLLRSSLCLQVLAHALGPWLPEDGAPLPAGVGGRDLARLRRVRDRLHEEPGAEHSLEALAELACMSASSLRTKYRVAFGRTIFAELRELRLETARRKLDEGWTVLQAAEYVGFRHAANFSTAFRKRYGRTPTA